MDTPPSWMLTPPHFCPGGLASAGHVPPVPALVPARVHPGVQGQLSGGGAGHRRHGQRLFRRGRRVLHRLRRHAHRNPGRERDLACPQRDFRGHVAARVLPHRDMRIRSPFFFLDEGAEPWHAASLLLFSLCAFVSFFLNANFSFYRHINQDYLLITSTVYSRFFSDVLEFYRTLYEGKGAGHIYIYSIHAFMLKLCIEALIIAGRTLISRRCERTQCWNERPFDTSVNFLWLFLLPIPFHPCFSLVDGGSGIWTCNLHCLGEVCVCI